MRLNIRRSTENWLFFDLGKKGAIRANLVGLNLGMYELYTYSLHHRKKNPKMLLVQVHAHILSTVQVGYWL